MPILVDIDVMPARRKMSVGELADRVGMGRTGILPGDRPGPHAPAGRGTRVSARGSRTNSPGP